MFIATRKFKDSETSTTYERGGDVIVSPRRAEELMRQGLIEERLETTIEQPADAGADPEPAIEQPAEVVADQPEVKHSAKAGSKGKKS